jgi:HSP20 family protein
MLVRHAVYAPLLPSAAFTADGAWSPSVDICELPDKYIVFADLPGVEPGGVDVTAEGDTLTIAGSRRDRQSAGGVPFRVERPTGRLRRSLRLPGPYDRTKISAQIHDGVLEIHVPKWTPFVEPAATRTGADARRPRPRKPRQVDRSSRSHADGGAFERRARTGESTLARAPDSAP